MFILIGLPLLLKLGTELCSSLAGKNHWKLIANKELHKALFPKLANFLVEEAKKLRYQWVGIVSSLTPLRQKCIGAKKVSAKKVAFFKN